MIHKKISSDLFLLILLVVRLRLDSDFDHFNRWNREPESREVRLGSSFAYTQTNFHLPYSNIRLSHPKSLDLNEFDEAHILFNRLNYFNSVRERRSHLLAYYASSPDGQNSGPATDSARADGTGRDAGPANPSLPTGSADIHDLPCGLQSEASSTQTSQDLTREDMDLIEILWKQDIDLGVTRDAYDTCQCLEAEKLKDLEYSKEQMQEFLSHDDVKGIEDGVSSLVDELAGFNYTIDSETGEYIFDELGSLGEAQNSGGQLLQDNSTGALRQDSYLPFDENAQILNLTEAFSPSTIEQMLPENLNSNSEFFLSQIEELEKELAQFESLNDTSARNFILAGDMFPNLDDCLSDATNMLPLLALSGTYQESFTSLSPRAGPEYNNLINDNSIPLASTILNRSGDSFTNLLQSPSLEVASTDEAFQTIPSVIGPSSIGCAVAESMATLTNDTDPLPTSSVVNTGYNAEVPEILYTNQTVSQNELPFSELLLDDDYMLVGLPSEVQGLSSEDNVDSSCDTASFTSGQNPSTSECADIIDSCSESSSQYGDREEFDQNGAFLPNSHISSSFNQHQSFELFHSAMPPKKQKQVQIRNLDRENRKLNEAHLSNDNHHNPPYFTYKNSIPDISQNSGEMMASASASPCKKFDLTIPRPAGAGCNDFLLHNHSYHLPFVNDNSRYKPFVRDKCKTSSDDDYCNKDEKRAKELKLPISIDDIINLAIDEYNERLAKYELTEAQLTLIRDIRRRGKNKVAAQNCRKRKMDQISHLQQDLDVLHRERLQLKTRQNHLYQQKHHIEDKYTQLYQLVLQSTNTKPPSPPNNRPLHSSNEITFSMTSDSLMSDDDTDLSRGARTKRKMKK